MTYKELVDIVVNKMLTHKLVNESIYATRWEVNEHAKPGRKYFLSVLVPISSTLTEAQINYSFQLVVMDVISKTENNKLQIQSDCAGILNDFYNYLAQTDELVVSAVPAITMFEENFGDFCAGAAMELNLAVDNTGSCNLPFE